MDECRDEVQSAECRVQSSVDAMLKAEQERAERLEIMLFAFVWNRTAYPIGKSLGKNEDEIMLKTLEIVNAGVKMVDFEKARQRLDRARELMKERGGYGGDEDI